MTALISTKHAQTLRDYAKTAGLPIGSCVAIEPLVNEPQYAEILGQEFNMCVAENAFKQYSVWMGPYEYKFDDTDRLAAFARHNGMVLRGHALVWHLGIPNWLINGNYDPDQVRDLLRGYIHAIVGRYKGEVSVWDVVNEAVTDGDDSDYRFDSFWYRVLGPEYLELAFTWAHEADPDALLFYNDYESEALTPKANRIYRLVRELQASGAPIHGVGLQGHLINGWRVSDDNRTNVRRIARLGLDWQITEADIRMELNGAPPSEVQLADQAESYRGLIELCLTEPRCTGFVTWGFTDAHSWIPGFRNGWGASLPFDEQYRPKPAYDAIVDALQGSR